MRPDALHYGYGYDHDLHVSCWECTCLQCAEIHFGCFACWNYVWGYMFCSGDGVRVLYWLLQCVGNCMYDYVYDYEYDCDYDYHYDYSCDYYCDYGFDYDYDYGYDYVYVYLYVYVYVHVYV